MLEEEKAHVTITFVIFGDVINGGEFQLHSVKVNGKEAPDLVTIALFSKIFDVDLLDTNSSETQSIIENDDLYYSSSNKIKDNNYIDSNLNTSVDEEHNNFNFNDTSDYNDYEYNTFYQSDTLTPEQAKEIVKDYFELSDNAVTYMPEHNFGADTTYQYAFCLHLPMTDGSEGLYSMWILVEDDTGFMYWGTWNDDYLVPSGEPFS